jgi:hypothetical protein
MSSLVNSEHASLPFTIAGGAGLEAGVSAVAAGVAAGGAGVDADALVAVGVWLDGALLHAHVKSRARSNTVFECLNMLVDLWR